MSVRTQQSLSGFVAGDPQLTFTTDGDARLYMRVGQAQYRRLDDGTFQQTGTEYTDLVQFRRAAEHAYERFRRGDRFIAEGYTHEWDRSLEDGTVEHHDEFVAKKLGHDCARTGYTVDRDPRDDGPGAAAAAGAGRSATGAAPRAHRPSPAADWPAAAIAG